MKFMLGRNVAGVVQKSDAKRWPYTLRTAGGVAICQRSYSPDHTPEDIGPGYGGPTLYEPVESSGYVLGHKIQCVHPDEETTAAPLAMHLRAKRRTYSAEFPEPARVAVSATQVMVNPWPVMSDTFCTIEEYEISPASPPTPAEWGTELREVTVSGCTVDDGAFIESGPLLYQSGLTDPARQYMAQFYCRRVLVFEGIAHDGTGYPDTVLRASAGTEPPDGAKWRMRPKPLTVGGSPVVDSDTRFEPFFYPASHCDFRRMMAAHWDGPAVIHASDTPSTVAFGNVDDAPDVEAHLSGAAIVCRFKDVVTDFLDKVPAGIRHTLIIDANVHHVKKRTAAGNANRFRFFAITGRATIII